MRTAGITKPISTASERRSALICSVRRSDAIGRVDQRQQRVAELDFQVVDLERGGDRLVRGVGLGGRFGFLGVGCGGELRALVDR